MKKIKIPHRSNIKSVNYKWVVQVVVITFVASSTIAGLCDFVLGKANLFFSISLLLVIILLGVLFDIVGTASAVADESPFHSMAAGKVLFANNAIFLIRNAEKVGSICNDVVGDITGIISGTFATVIVLKIVKTHGGLFSTLVYLFFAGFIAAITIGVKAIGKTFALAQSNKIIYFTAMTMKSLGIDLKNKKRKKSVES